MAVVSQDEEFPDTLALWPDKEVTELVNAFRSTFPKQTRRGAPIFGALKLRAFFIFFLMSLSGLILGLAVEHMHT